MREAHVPLPRPVEQSSGERAGLGHESEAPRARADVGEARIETDPRHEQTDAVGAEDAQLERPRDTQHRLGESAANGCRPLQARADHDQSRRHLVPRHPIDAIEGIAQKIGSGIVVMGAISRSGLRRLAIGNTAERVFDALSCDLLVVKPKSFTSRVPRARRGAQLVTLPVIQPGM